MILSGVGTEKGDLLGKPFKGDFDYRSVVGKLNYLEEGSRPDIAYAVHQCARAFASFGPPNHQIFSTDDNVFSSWKKGSGRVLPVAGRSKYWYE